MKLYVSQIQSIFQRERIPRLAHARRPHAHQLALAQPAAARDTQAAWLDSHIPHSVFSCGVLTLILVTHSHNLT